MPDAPSQFLISRPHPGSGVGSNLASFAGAVWYAQQSGRTLIVDWRDSAFLKDKSLNYFTEFFEAVEAIQGVPIEYAPSRNCPPPGEESLVGVTLARGALQGSDAPRYLVIRDYHGLERLDPKSSEASQFWRLKDFYRDIRPRDFIRQEIDRFAAEHFQHAFVVGVNLSSGNGEFAKGETYAGRVDIDIFSKDRIFLRKVEKARAIAARGLPRGLRGEARIFFATDAFPMHALLSQLPNAVTRRTMFPPPGVGRVYCDYNDPAYTDRDAIVDAIVDMLLLARCHALVRNGSVFNTYAQTVTNCFNGNVQHIERLYARYWIRAGWSHLKKMAGR